jgi:hypothetical protein
MYTRTLIYRLRHLHKNVAYQMIYTCKALYNAKILINGFHINDKKIIYFCLPILRAMAHFYPFTVYQLSFSALPCFLFLMIRRLFSYLPVMIRKRKSIVSPFSLQRTPQLN